MTQFTPRFKENTYNYIDKKVRQYDEANNTDVMELLDHNRDNGYQLTKTDEGEEYYNTVLAGMCGGCVTWDEVLTDDQKDFINSTWMDAEKYARKRDAQEEEACYQDTLYNEKHEYIGPAK